ncbi:MAG: divergent polysaccharide deacetylase family protein [Paenirhodobacter sp.]|uniref:divergent polysaccharide deacetylase family protein n=1 Tax=Paenirhodobacter sp. TaxID=1965326 RepID=UPI003D0FFE80
MVRGFITGIGAGSLVAVLGLGALMLVAPAPQPANEAGAPHAGSATPAPDLPAPSGSPAVAVPAGSEFARSGTDQPPQTAPESAAPEADTAAPEAPVAEAGAPAPAPMPGTEPPARPEAESAAPAVPTAPEVPAAALDQAPPPEAPVGVPPPGEARAPDLPMAETPAPVAPAAPEPAPETAEAPQAAPVPAPEVPAEAPAEEITLMPDGAIVPPGGDAKPRVFRPGDGTGFANAEGTTVNRLPSVGARPMAPAMPKIGGAETPKTGFKRPPSAEAPEPAPESAPADPAPAAVPKFSDAVPVTPAPGAESFGSVASAAPLTDDAPLKRFAGTWTSRPGVPYFAVVLVDVGTAAGGLDRETIKALGLPLTVAIDPARPDAAEAAADYRAAGIEVAILADALPAQAAPQDAEVALEAWRQRLPEAVALIEAGRPVFQDDRRLAQEYVRALGADGMGLVTQATGVDSAGQIAAAARLARAQVWRELDQRRDKAAVLVRTLSRAAFEASRRGGVTVMLSSWPESIAALGEWKAEVGEGVNFVPVSAVAVKSLEK